MQDSEKMQSSEQIDALPLELGRLQRAAQQAQLPIVIVLDGWEAAGKGTLINSLAQSLDSRGYRVVSIRPADEQAPLFPPLHRFWLAMPEAGRITIFDRSWYNDLWIAHARRRVAPLDLAEELAELHAFEQMLVDSGVLIVKFFLQVDQAEQSKRFGKLKRHGFTRWRLDSNDLHQNRHFKRWAKAAQAVLFANGSPGVRPFFVCQANNKQRTRLAVLQELTQTIGGRLSVSPPEPETSATCAVPVYGASTPTTTVDATRTLPLAAVDLSQRLSREEYTEQLPKLQERLRELEHRIYAQRIPVVISFEGWDAAGKGGAIRRLVAGLDPRGYDVHSISAPSDVERKHHYLWRFWTRIPKGGHLAIFDRSWYGRVLVERVEGFCNEADWRRAYHEIAAFEQTLVDARTVLVKFWFHIDADTQILRFRDRQNKQDKQWKITEEDWRNRKRWDDYEMAVNDMLTLNNSLDCPYWIVPANDKLFARIFTLRKVIDAIEQELARRKETLGRRRLAL